MKLLLVILNLMTLKESNAQNQHEFEIMKSVIIDNFSQWKDTSYYKTGKIKGIKAVTKRKSIVIKETTVPNTLDFSVSNYHRVKENIFNSLDSSAYSDFLVKKNTVLNIQNLHIPKSIINTKYIDTLELDNIFQNGGWEKFNKMYSASTDLVGVSRVGFNTDKTQALVYYSRSNCGLCGSGYLCLYEFRNGKWSLVGKYMEWIS